MNKKNILTLGLFIACLHSCITKAEPCPTYFSDQHDVCRLVYHSDHWQHLKKDWKISIQNDGGGSNDEKVCYISKNIRVKSTTDQLLLILKKTNKKMTICEKLGHQHHRHFCKDKTDHNCYGYFSGKITMRRSITDYAPQHGYLEVKLVQPQVLNYQSQSPSQLPQSVHGLWPALWLLPWPAWGQVWAQGGEIDLMEVMDQGKTSILPEQKAFSTLHFGDVRYGTPDAFYRDEQNNQHWGFLLANYRVNSNIPDTYGFEWKKIKNNYWQMNFYFNKKLIWTKNVNRDKNTKFSFYDFEKNKIFYDDSFSKKIDSALFSPQGTGDPVKIFTRGLNNRSGLDGYHLIINITYGGNPFKYGFSEDADFNLLEAVMVIQSVKIWEIKDDL